MLEELRYTQVHWSEETSIGRLVLGYTPDMVKAYPPFVNFFENTKEMLQQCDRENPRLITSEHTYTFSEFIYIKFCLNTFHCRFINRNYKLLYGLELDDYRKTNELF